MTARVPVRPAGAPPTTATLWFKFATVGVKPSAPPMVLGPLPAKKMSAVFLKRTFNAAATSRGPGADGAGGAFDVADAPLAAFCLPLGPDAQTPKDRMAPEVGPVCTRPPAATIRGPNNLLD
jgi:hypothetical protein